MATAQEVKQYALSIMSLHGELYPSRLPSQWSTPSKENALELARYVTRLTHSVGDLKSYAATQLAAHSFTPPLLKRLILIQAELSSAMVYLMASRNKMLIVAAGKMDDENCSGAIALAQDRWTDLREHLSVLRELAADVEATSILMDASSPLWQAIDELRKDVDTAVTPNDKGDALERLLEAIIKTVPGMTVDGRNVITSTEEIDLVVRNATQRPEWRNDGPVILFECKNWLARAPRVEFTALEGKMRNRMNRCTLGFLISWSGFTGPVNDERLRMSRGDLVIGLLDGEDIDKAIKARDFEQVLLNAWSAAVMQ